MLLLAAIALPAAAQPGLNLSWDDCQASAAGGLNKISTCQSNTEAAKVMFGSYVLPSDVQALVGNDIVLDICTNSSTLPCWWNFTAAPRTTGYQVLFNQPCAHNAFAYWSTISGGVTTSSMAVLMPTAASPRIRVVATAAVDPKAAHAVPASIGEIYSFTFRLLHGASAGGKCSGCMTSAGIVLRLVRVTQAGAPPIEITTPSSRNFVYWQGGAQSPPGCEFTPVVNTTWGSVKALYR